VSVDNSYPSKRYASYVLFVLLLAHIVAFLDRQILALLIEPIKTELSVSDTQLGFLHGFAFAIFYTAMGIPLGRLADRTTRTRLIAVGVLFWSVATACCGLARQYWVLLLARVGVGIGEASLLPSAYSIISDMYPRRDRSRPISFFALGPFVGAGIAFLVGGFIVRAVSSSSGFELPFFGELSPWRLVFLIIAVPGLLVAALVLSLREPVRREKSGNSPDGAKGVSLRFATKFLMQQRRTYFSIYVGFSFLALMSFSFFAWIPTLLIRVHGFDVPGAGFLFGGILLLFGATGTFCGGLIADKLQQRGRQDAQLLVGVAAAACMLVGGAVTPLISQTNLMAMCLALTIFAHGIPVGMAPAALQAITPNEMRGQINAVYNLTVSFIGIGMGPLLVALFTDYVFEDASAVGRSLSAVSIIAGPPAILVLLYGLKPYRARLSEWTEQLPAERQHP
jgi:MFS family permease